MIIYECLFVHVKKNVASLLQDVATIRQHAIFRGWLQQPILPPEEHRYGLVFQC